MKALVTGGAGFIGSHIVDKLVERGYEVVVLDTETSQVHDHFYYNSNATYYKLDVADYEKTREHYNDVDYVFHCAAESRIQPATLNPLLTIKTNVLGTGTVLQCSREANVKKVIYSSTSSGYGLKNTPPLSEDMPDDCLNPYSVSKISGEKLCSMYTRLFGLKTVILRYFNVYGPREPLKGPYAPVVGLFLRQHRAGESLTIVPDGTQRRDFTHINDVVNANLLAMDKECKTYGEIFNVGTGKNYSVLELASLISSDFKFINPRLGEAYITLANNKKIKEEFGWVPTEDIEQYIKDNLWNNKK